MAYFAVAWVLPVGHALLRNSIKREGGKGTWLVSGFGREEQAHQFYEELGYRATPATGSSRVPSVDGSTSEDS